MPRRLATALVVALAVALAGCSSGEDGATQQEATLLLDFVPNGVHAGIYLARDRDFPSAGGVELDVEVPGSSSDALKLLRSRRADFAILDLHDLAIAREKGADAVAVMAIVQRPLASVVAAPDVARPRDLEGRRVGVAGLPSDDAVLDSIVAGDGGDPERVRRTTIGFEAVRSLLTGRVAAATAFWNVEGLEVQARREGTKVFRLDEFGAPRYPELVLVTTRETASDRPKLVQTIVTALQRGYREALLDPESAVSAMTARVDGLDREQLLRQLDAVSQAFRNVDGAIGTFDIAGLRRWAAWEAEVGITEQPPEVAVMFAPRFPQRGWEEASLASG